MKKIIYLLLGAILTLTSCFEDEGNYDYKEINPPHWIQDFSMVPEYLVGYMEGDIVGKGSRMFVWDTDSLQRASEVRYEWVVNNRVISEEIDFKMPVSEFMEKAGIKVLEDEGAYTGSFNIIEKETGITFMAKLSVWLYPYYAPDDWFILADDGGKTNVASLRSRLVAENGNTVEKFILQNYDFENRNGGATIPGKPISMAWAKARDFGTQGSITVMTDQVAYEMNAENLEKISEPKEQFLDGTPANFKPLYRADLNASSEGELPCTYLVDASGAVYARQMSANYLGGRYLTEPYQMDNKGYKCAFFGNSRYAGTIPGYDEKNRRLMFATSWREDIEGSAPTYRIILYPATESKNSAPISEFPEGTEVLHLSVVGCYSFAIPRNSSVYTVVYNDPAKPDVTISSDFCINDQSMKPVYYQMATHYAMERLDKSSQILISGTARTDRTSKNAASRTFYSVGNKLKYVQRAQDWYAKPQRVVEFPYSFDSKITCLTYAYLVCDRLVVGCENGDLFIFDINFIDSPQLLFKGKVKGKVMECKQLGQRRPGNDTF